MDGGKAGPIVQVEVMKKVKKGVRIRMCASTVGVGEHGHEN